VLGDEGRLVRTLVNLFGNAIRVTPRAGHIRLRCRPVVEQGHVLFSLSDTGCGIPADALDRVFEKFYRVERGDGVASSGLGLTFCKLTVEAHGGRIWVESEPGRGSTFHFTIPAAS
jgi:signal transduction histidine kinase